MDKIFIHFIKVMRMPCLCSNLSYDDIFLISFSSPECQFLCDFHLRRHLSHVRDVMIDDVIR